MIIDQMLFLVASMGSLPINNEFTPYASASVSQKKWILNSSNQGKIEEFRYLFAEYGISLNTTSIDLKEVDAEPLTVATHKASQMPEHVLIEDTSLEIEGIDVGIHLRSLFNNLIGHMDQYVGKKAVWRVILAFKDGNFVYLYEGVVKGTFIYSKSEKSPSFDSYFLPEGAEQTFSEIKPKRFNARALALKALMENKPIAIRPVILEWQGPWQTY